MPVKKKTKKAAKKGTMKKAKKKVIKQKVKKVSKKKSVKKTLKKSLKKKSAKKARPAKRVAPPKEPKVKIQKTSTPSTPLNESVKSNEGSIEASPYAVKEVAFRCEICGKQIYIDSMGVEERVIYCCGEPMVRKETE